ncbi:MBL fold metallo-hydrolase [Patescibacteria group bacterium]|nr:MBL fold metallo-hydrolase [Patescibacteria group bacterium]
MLKYEVLVLGELRTNCYLLWDDESRETAIIDAADDGVAISEIIESRGLIAKIILATHGHFDHNMGVLDLKLIYNIPFACSEKDMFLLKRQRETASHFLGNIDEIAPNINKIDIDLDKKDKIKLGENTIKIMKSPGHTPGGVCFLANNFLFCGDTIFAEGLRGDTRHGYSSTTKIHESIAKILKLPNNTVILPGHGEETSVIDARMFFKGDE